MEASETFHGITLLQEVDEFRFPCGGTTGDDEKGEIL
jgi:hypothetical protein